MPKVGEHAVVCGASMAGLLAARVLTDHYDRVTVVERDVLTDEAVARKGFRRAVNRTPCSPGVRRSSMSCSRDTSTNSSRRVRTGGTTEICRSSTSASPAAARTARAPLGARAAPGDRARRTSARFRPIRPPTTPTELLDFGEGIAPAYALPRLGRPNRWPVSACTSIRATAGGVTTRWPGCRRVSWSSATPCAVSTRSTGRG